MSPSLIRWGSRIDLKPGCKFKFVHGLETLSKKMMIVGHEGTLAGPFHQKLSSIVVSNVF